MDGSNTTAKTPGNDSEKLVALQEQLRQLTAAEIDSQSLLDGIRTSRLSLEQLILQEQESLLAANRQKELDRYETEVVNDNRMVTADVTVENHDHTSCIMKVCFPGSSGHDVIVTETMEFPYPPNLMPNIDGVMASFIKADEDMEVFYLDKGEDRRCKKITVQMVQMKDGTITVPRTLAEYRKERTEVRITGSFNAKDHPADGAIAALLEDNAKK